LTDIEDDHFQARIVLKKNGDIAHIDCIPVDARALAMSLQARTHDPVPMVYF
jgi:bifunctional DNase/RNase